MSETEVPTYQPPAGVHGPTLGRDLPDGCEWLEATYRPDTAAPGLWGPRACTTYRLYWWRWPAIKVGDQVAVTGTVQRVYGDGMAVVAIGDDATLVLAPAALRHLTDQDGDR